MISDIDVLFKRVLESQIKTNISIYSYAFTEIASILYETGKIFYREEKNKEWLLLDYSTISKLASLY